jgi:hypothetical protein
MASECKGVEEREKGRYQIFKVWYRVWRRQLG